jgi:hypothetical protein
MAIGRNDEVSPDARMGRTGWPCPSHDYDDIKTSRKQYRIWVVITKASLMKAYGI